METISFGGFYATNKNFYPQPTAEKPTLTVCLPGSPCTFLLGAFCRSVWHQLASGTVPSCWPQSTGEVEMEVPHIQQLSLPSPGCRDELFTSLLVCGARAEGYQGECEYPHFLCWGSYVPEPGLPPSIRADEGYLEGKKAHLVHWDGEFLGFPSSV